MDCFDKVRTRLNGAGTEPERLTQILDELLRSFEDGGARHAVDCLSERTTEIDRNFNTALSELEQLF